MTPLFKTQRQDQRQVLIRVVEGERERPEACTQVGACAIEAPAGLPAATPIHVNYSYQPSGRLEVRAQIAGHKAATVAALQRGNALSSEQVQLWQQCVFSDSD